MASMISLTNKAAEHVRSLLEEHEGSQGLRIFVEGGGCAGFQYGFDLATEPKDTDHVFEEQGVKIFLDRKSALHLVGCEVDFEKTLLFSGFKVKNPNASTSCGCGVSFSV